jgi:16S rRNA (adenine1518-N6/adenine1519-N6)-dimethyltransferase
MSDIHFIKGLGADWKLGQNFLLDKTYIARELEFCNAGGKRVLEIGPGLGALTVGLGSVAGHLTAIEIDERFIPILREKTREFKTVEIVQGNALEFEGGPFDLIVSNLPYYIASKLLVKISSLEFSEAIICIQKELAVRMVAQPGSRDYSRLSVVCQLMFDIKLLGGVPAGAFYPKPKVSSAFVRLKKKGTVPEGFSHFINAIFQHKNKKLRNAIIDSREMLGMSKEKAVVAGDALTHWERKVFTLTIEEISSSFSEYRRITR